jgi:hypothetical protein
VSTFCWQHCGGGQTKEDALSIEDQNMNALGPRLLGALGNPKTPAKQRVGGVKDGHVLVVEIP